MNPGFETPHEQPTDLIGLSGRLPGLVERAKFFALNANDVDTAHRKRPGNRRSKRRTRRVDAGAECAPVFDPNILIAALLSPMGAPAQLVGRWLSGEFELVLSDALLGEFERHSPTRS